MFCYCAASRRLARTLTARYDAALQPCGLTAAQFETLNVLQAVGDCSGRALAERLALDKTTLSRNLKPLLATGWVAANASKDDARQVLYGMTASGRKTLKKAMPMWQAAHDASLAMLGAQAAASQKSLQRMVQALG